MLLDHRYGSREDMLFTSLLTKACLDGAVKIIYICKTFALLSY